MQRGDVASVQMNRVKNPNSKIKAMANVTFANGLVLKGVKVISWENDYFVGMPSVEDKKEQDPKKRWKSICYFVDRQDKDVLTEVVLETFQKEIASDSKDEDDGEFPFPVDEGQF